MNRRVMSVPETVSASLAGWGVDSGAKVLVAFSGGADSTALLAAAVQAGYSVMALHCNFHLRGAESDRDERFCREMAARIGAGLLVRHFDVKARVAATGESVEMAAREMRYAWFDEVHASEGAPLLTAHHNADNVETFFLNLLRGSGLRGLAGIPPRRGYIMRPLLGVGKEEILEYLASSGLDYVTDSTNLQPDFRRNMLRLEILPELERRFPGATDAVGHTMDNLRRDSDLLHRFVDDERRRRTSPSGALSLDGLGKEDATLLFHLLDGALDYATVERILLSHGLSGKIFSGGGGVRFLLDRGYLSKIEGDREARAPEISATVLPVGEFHPSRDTMEIWLDGSVLDTPEGEWELRTWRHSDRIAPFGMRGTRAVSSIIAEARVPLTEKGNIWVLTFGGELIWVVGFRASRHFPVTPRSGRVVRLRVVR